MKILANIKKNIVADYSFKYKFELWTVLEYFHFMLLYLYVVLLVQYMYLKTLVTSNFADCMLYQNPGCIFTFLYLIGDQLWKNPDSDNLW